MITLVGQTAKVIAIGVAKIVAKMDVLDVKAAVEKDAEDARDVQVSVEDV
ncbi:MAG: hypothetical protein K5882_10095 [Bacteroidales bacterium]|nr:hypothetical protein [Bacteroidales bacterium]